MANVLYHNKWHSFNHHTIPSDEYGDSATDPIASREYPFRGLFFNTFPLSTVEGNIITKNQSDSYGWWFYYNLTWGNSADWGLWSSVRQNTSGALIFNPNYGTVTYNYERWSDGYIGFTYWSGYTYTLWRQASGRMLRLYTNTFDFSATPVWPLSTERGFPPISGRGWNIALSSITWRTNVSAVNTRQKNFAPALELFSNEDNTLYWDVSTGQTAYFRITENKTITATKLFNVKKGGKYTMWVSLDFCKEDQMDLYFAYDTYRIQIVKYPRTDSYTDNTRVVRLSANNITRIDFVYDGRYMLGKATHYLIFLPTNDDLYYEGIGNTLDPNPWYVNDIGFPGRYIVNQRGIRIQQIGTTFTDVSSIYVAGSGVTFDYFGTGFQLFSFALVGAQWLPILTYANNRSLTGSFDRLWYNLYGDDGYDKPYDPRNLVATPSKNTAPNIMFDAYPNPPYEFQKIVIKEIPQCLSGLRVFINSGKDRDIRNVSVNRAGSTPLPPLKNGKVFRYNFNNERQATLFFRRVQSNARIEASFRKQAPLVSLSPVVWFDFIDQNTTTFVNNNSLKKLSKIESKPDSGFFAVQNSIPSMPVLCETDVSRVSYFANYNGVGRFMTSNKSITGIMADVNNATQGLVDDIAMFLVAEVDSINSNENCIPFGIGQTAAGRGFGTEIRGDILYWGPWGRDTANILRPTRTVSQRIQPCKPFLLTMQMGRQAGTDRYSLVTLFNGLVQLRDNTVNDPNTTLIPANYNLILGTGVDQNNNILSNKFGKIKIHSLIIYNKKLTTGQIRSINTYLIDKHYIREGYGTCDCVADSFLPTTTPTVTPTQTPTPTPTPTLTPTLTIATANISWNTNSIVVTAYPPLQNENDRPRINTFRSDGSFIIYMSAGSQIYNPSTNSITPAPWGNRTTGTEIVSIPLTSPLFAGVDIFVSDFDPDPVLTPPIEQWTITSTGNPNEIKYQYILQPGNNVINVSWG